ncbi:hypothetical protein V3W47_17505 [Deinococcus sp. YIM 134068]|uniref:hypothetical protein n=1 Tax=Deinococcus lichenicola TaxID=3118910 RepID=UPI002F91E1C0
MGTDIHESYEVREGGRWVERVFQPPADFHRMTARERAAYFDHPARLTRNYALFAILADVRNGVADVPGSTFFPTIAPPRGLPADVSPKIRRASRDLGDGEEDEEWGYSHSWFTLRELLEYDWERRVVRLGVVNAAEYARFRREGRPGGWAEAIAGPNVVPVSHAEMDALLEREPHLVLLSWKEPGMGHPAARDGRTYITSVRWEETCSEAVGPFVTRTLPFLRAQVDDPDDLRLVFWFSS